MRDLTPLLGIMFAIGLCLIFFVVWRVKFHRREVEEREEQRRVVEERIREGVLTRDGRPACMICGVAATEYAPVTGKSWMDKLPLLNRLFSLPPRYVIEDDILGDTCLCRLHKQVAVKKLEEFHALLRAERARFNSTQEDKCAQMDGGGLHRLVKQQFQASIRTLGTPMPDSPPHRQLEAGSSDDDDAIMTLVSSGPSLSHPDEDGPEE